MGDLRFFGFSFACFWGFLESLLGLGLCFRLMMAGSCLLCLGCACLPWVGCGARLLGVSGVSSAPAPACRRVWSLSGFRSGLVARYSALGILPFRAVASGLSRSVGRGWSLGTRVRGWWPYLPRLSDSGDIATTPLPLCAVAPSPPFLPLSPSRSVLRSVSPEPACRRAQPSLKPSFAQPLGTRVRSLRHPRHPSQTAPHTPPKAGRHTQGKAGRSPPSSISAPLQAL